jgi:hypothetical protein
MNGVDARRDRMSTSRKVSRIGARIASFAAVLVVAIVLMPGSARGDRSLVRVRALTAANALEDRGFSCRGGSQIVYLESGYAYTLQTTLFRGNRYALLGFGDDGVRDLDLELYDENWHLISHDTSVDNYPVVDVEPRWTGTFYYKIIMYSGEGHATALICYLD